MPRSTRERMIDNMVKTYGAARAAAFIRGLEEGRSAASLATELGVTRQRANQWADAFGTRVTIYTPHPEVTEALKRAAMSSRRAIPEYEGLYEVSTDGVVHSLERTVQRTDGSTQRVRGRALRATTNGDGYLMASRWVMQRVVDPQRGDCYRAAVASALGLALDSVPESVGEPGEFAEFLRVHGLCGVTLRDSHLKAEPPGYGGVNWDARVLVQYDHAQGSLALASVPSQRYPGQWHAIVVGFVLQTGGWVEVKCLHDPNPSNKPYDMSTTRIRRLTFILPAAK